MRLILRSALGVAVLAATIWFAPEARAATVQVSGGTVVFTAAPGEANDVRTGTLLFHDQALHVADDGAPLTAVGPGCQQLDAHNAVCPEDSDQPHPLVIDTRDGDDRVLEDEQQVRHVTIRTGAGNDRVTVGSFVSIHGEVDGGAGDDTLKVFDNSGNTLSGIVVHGGAGDDALTIGEQPGGSLYGDAGDDRLVVPSVSRFGPQLLDGGTGDDTYSFSFSGNLLGLGPLTTTIAPGPGFDTLDQGGNQNDGLMFDMATCPDCVESVIGSPAADHITGDGHSQAIFGEGGDDVLDGGGGFDVIAGQDGDDTITSRDGTFDVVGCGDGTDTVAADRFDLVNRDCETVTRGARRA